MAVKKYICYQQPFIYWFRFRESKYAFSIVYKYHIKMKNYKKERKRQYDVQKLVLLFL